MSLNSVAVVILNWNGKHFLEKFLPSLIEHTSFAELIVADNCSTDDSLSFLKENFPQIRIITLAENYGFAKGYNEALKQVNSDVYVLLNSDVEVTENWLQPCLEILKKDNDMAACQPKIKAFHQKTYFEYAGAAGGFIDKYGYPFCRGRIFETLEEDNNQYDEEIEIFWATGACLVIRADIYHELNGLDSFFFAHMEEIDLCWRIQNRGKKIKYVPQSTVFHVGGGTLHKSKPQKTFLNFRNNLIM
ncbi:MAG: glycosyltransferase family 2 protein, partial [Vicingaceae bacterium]|nr:glycosyltransferase family 2 protein [Vicingaceae bacterium]